MRVESIAGLLLLIACGPSRAPTPSPGAPDTQAADVVTDLMTEALRADARMERADTLYDPSAVIVADGERRSGVPRYAGVTPNGQVVVGSSQVEVSRSFAWAYLEYRWLSPDQNLARVARLTVLLVPNRAGTYKILQAHSSSVR
jgi:hypothetical protein